MNRVALKSPVCLAIDRNCPKCNYPSIGALIDYGNPRPNVVARYCRACGWIGGDQDTLLAYFAEVAPKYHLPGHEPPPSKWAQEDLVRECGLCGTALKGRQRRYCGGHTREQKEEATRLSPEKVDAEPQTS